jgi:hypothetical protein
MRSSKINVEYRFLGQQIAENVTQFYFLFNKRGS